jgi:hypothetical protein
MFKMDSKGNVCVAIILALRLKRKADLKQWVEGWIAKWERYVRPNLLKHIQIKTLGDFQNCF